MDILILVFWLIVGFALIIKGGDWFVDAAVYVAKITGIPNFIIGATIVSLATTLPEVLVSVLASSRGNVDLAIGNAYGSVIANLGFILGISLSIMPPKIATKDIIQKGLFMIALTIISAILMFDYLLIFTESLVLWAMLAIFLWMNLRNMKSKSSTNNHAISHNSKDTKTQIFLFIVGSLMVIFGADLLVNNASTLASRLDIPQAVVGLTVVAIGTSLPELVTTIMSIVKKQAGLSIGNIVGANVLNISLALPASVLASNNNLITRPETITTDIPFSLWFMALTIIPAIIFKRFYKWQGYLLLISYVIYLIQTIM
jgi:cation:H+ antiporter